ncbi:hypothetical protein EKK58_02160 [Candidatus Dependentiae bacterium]|nr:MAG: hypothetical protein EKK58_02160 [Candidatus Dependentiae bacterium]
MGNKLCNKCGKTKFRAEFNRNKSRKDGLQDYCKLCQAEGNKKYVLANPDKRKRTIKNYCKAAGSKFYLKSKELRSVKIKALAALQVAMRQGIISRLPCKICGSLKTEGHHHSYLARDFLNVTFLCGQHHKAWHRAFLPTLDEDQST